MNHVAVYITNAQDKKELLERIYTTSVFGDFSASETVLFSDITIEKYINQERIYGTSPVSIFTKNGLISASQGERKKALLEFLSTQKFSHLIVDNVFGNLDFNAQIDIKNRLTEFSKTAKIIQILNRKDDVLPFIENYFDALGNRISKSTNTTIKNTYFNSPLPQLDNSITLNINPIVKFENVNVSYNNNNPILKDINWQINQGEFWQLIGPNGSGKSTILSMIFGENPKAFNQQITLFGKLKGSGESVWDIKKNIGYYSSDLQYGFKRLDAVGNMVVSGFFDTIGLYKMPTQAQINSAEQWLHVLNLHDKRKLPFLELSKGHQCLVLIARAMLKHPPLLILDEPTNGLDDTDVSIFTALINKIATETDTTILYVSHRIEIGLMPQYKFQLTPSKLGSTGAVL